MVVRKMSPLFPLDANMISLDSRTMGKPMMLLDGLPFGPLVADVIETVCTADIPLAEMSREYIKETFESSDDGSPSGDGSAGNATSKSGFHIF